jgi:hypothetical protein
MGSPQVKTAHQVAYDRWTTERTEASRVAMRAHWEISLTCTGSRLDGISRETFSRCTPTVLHSDTRDDDKETGQLAYRGACLGCGWVSARSHAFGDGGENAAAEDANDHSHPAWRRVPIVKRPPYNDGGSSYRKAVIAWRNRWEPILPPGWLDQGGPIRTLRGGIGTRHVPGGAPGGGYDISADADTEAPGGQLALFQ